jgi:hypothetical protein
MCEGRDNGVQGINLSKSNPYVPDKETGELNN